MDTMNICLPPELAELVNAKVTSGLYPSATEVIRAGLRLLQEQDEIRRLRLEELRREIERGEESLARGESRVFHSGEELAAHIEAEGEQLSVSNLATKRLPIVNAATEQDPTLALFEQWKQEDAQKTPEEVEQERRLWEAFEQGINEAREAQGMRQL